MKAGDEFGLQEYGFNAMMSMRLEKSFGIWSAEFRQDYTPGETGMDRWIAWDKGDFIGREAALPSAMATVRSRQVVTLEVEADDADASGYEPVWQDGKLVGFVTSGGYGHTTGKSLAMAMVDKRSRHEGTEAFRAYRRCVERAKVIPRRHMTRKGVQCADKTGSL